MGHNLSSKGTLRLHGLNFNYRMSLRSLNLAMVRQKFVTRQYRLAMTRVLNRNKFLLMLQRRWMSR